MWPVKLFISVILLILAISTEALSPNGRHVCSSTRSEAYVAQERYTTKCGFLGLKRCTRHRAVTRYRTATDYRCCPSWVSVDNVHCDKAHCFGVQPAGVCSNGGTCVRPNVCTCRTGFTQPRCTDINECSSGNGGCQHSCVNSAGSYLCACNSGYGLLSNRKNCKPVCYGQTPGVCANGGTCAGPNSCRCRSGFALPQCADINECQTNNGGCSQLCDNLPGSFRCRCGRGYGILNDGKTCKPLCHGTPIGTCKNGGTCVNPDVCTCPVGFSTPKCDDINECNSNNGGCGQVCTNTVGSYQCSCEAGYGFVGTSDCKPICFGGAPGECPNGGKCLSPNRCSCRQGYSGSPCADVNECSRANGGCAQDCQNTVGSFTCSCKSGYQLGSDGKSCLAVCHGLPAGTCANGGTCIEPNVCTCPSGFSSPQCQDINECSSSNGGCEQDCENTVGSFKCKCSSGYQLANDGKSCTDIDECKAGTSGCSHFCVNDPGTYHCDCPLGYSLAADKRKCEDINECSTSNGGCNQKCNNNVGSFQCSCDDGYILDADKKTCQDSSDCGSKQFVWCWPQCTQAGSSCSCPAGHVLHQNGVNCIDPCFNRPCENGGVCSKPSPDSTSYSCDCTSTGYEGVNCESGIISLPQSVRVRAGELFEDITLTAFPEEEIILTAVSNTNVQIFPNQLFIRSPASKANFKVLAPRSGLYQLQFQVSGKNSASFTNVPSLEIRSDDVFSKFQIPFKGLPEGSFFIDLSIKGIDYRFTSTSKWYRLGSNAHIFFTEGVTFSSVGNVSLPLTVKGLEINAVDKLTIGPVSSLRTPSSGSEVSGNVVRKTRGAPFDLSLKDINDFIQSNSILNTLFALLKPLLPEWIKLAVDTDSPEPFFFAQISPGSTVNKLPYCKGAPLFDDTTYHVFRFTHAIIMTILNQDLDLPKVDSEEYCIIIDLNKDYGTTFIIMFPEKAAKLLESLSVFSQLQKDTGILIYPNGFGISLFRKLNVKTIASELELWNGDQQFTYALGDTATFWTSVDVGKAVDTSKDFDYGIAPVPIETYVALPDVRKIFTHVFIEPWEMYLRSIREPLEITIFARILKQKFPIKLSTGNFVHHSLQAYGSIGGEQERNYCGPTANPPGVFTTVFVDAKLLRGLPIIQDLAFNIELEAQAFYRLDNVDLAKVPRPIDIIKAVLNLIKEAAVELLNFVIAEILKYANLIAPVIMQTINLIRDLVQRLVNIVRDFLDSFNVNALVANVGDLVSDVITNVNSIRDQITQLVDQLRMMFVETLDEFVKFVKTKVEEIRTNALKLVKNLYEQTIGVFKGTKTIGVRGYFSIAVFGFFLGIEGEFVQSDAHLRRCGDLADIYEHMQGEEAWRAFGAIDVKIGLGGKGSSGGKIKSKIWSLLSVRLGFGFGLALASNSNNFVVRLHARLNFFGAKASADVFVTNKEIASRTQVDIWDIFTARLTIRATVFVNLADWALSIRGEFIAGGGRKRQAGNTVQASLGDAIRRFVTRLADEAVKRIDKAQEAVNKAKGKLSGAQRWLDEKKAGVDKANVVFDRAIEKLEGVKRKLEEAKGPFERALQKLRNAQKRVNGLCQIRDCPKICIPGFKFKICKKGWFRFPCPRWTKCMIKLPNLLCIARNVGCRIIRGIAFLALEAAKLFVRIPILALDLAKAAVSVAQVIVDKSRIILEVVKLAFHVAKGLLEAAKGALSVFNAALELVKFAARAVQYAINFIVKFGLQNIIDIRTCGFEIELSTRDLFEFEIFCEVNPFSLGWRTVRFRLNFRNILSSIWNAAKSLVNNFLDSIKNLFGRRKREIDFEVFSRLHKAFRFRRQTGNDTFDESVFENADFDNNTVLTTTTRESEIRFWEEQCYKYKPIHELLFRGFEELLNGTYELEAALEEVSTRGSETMAVLLSFYNLEVDDSGIDYNIAKEDFDLTPEQIQEAIKKANATIQEDELVKEGKGAAEYLVNGNEEAKSSFINSEVLPSWREQMDNVTKDVLLMDECSGFYDCIVWSFGELYQLVDSVNPNMLSGAQDSLPELEAQVYRLFENDSMTFTEVKSITLEILNMLRMLNGENVFCGTVPVITKSPANITASSGEDVNLSCSIESVPPPTYYWYKDEELFASGLNEGTLTLKTVNADDSGEYVCVGGNHVTNVTSYPASLNVVVPPTILTELPSKLDVAEGEQVSVLCNVSAIPEAAITWYLDSDKTFQVHNTTLFIPAAKLLDSGHYRCEARNEHGHAVSSEMVLIVLEASSRCVTVKLQVGFVSGNAQGVSVDDTLIQEDFTGLSLEAAFRQTVVTIINSTALGLTAKVTMFSIVANTADVTLTAGCDCLGSNCQADTHEFLASLAARLQSVVSSDKPLFILDGLVYNFNPSIVNPPDESTECPPGFKENPGKICVKSNDGAPQNLRVSRSINSGTITTYIINWDPPKDSPLSSGQQVYLVEVSNQRLSLPKTERVFSPAYGLLLTSSDGETTLRVRAIVKGGFGPYAEIVIPAVNAEVCVESDLDPFLVNVAMMGLCDTSQNGTCYTPTVNVLENSQLINSTDLECRMREILFDESGPTASGPETIVPGVFVSCTEVICPLPSTTLAVQDKSVIGWSIAVSNSGQQFINQKLYIPFDARCVSCTQGTTPKCTFNDQFCFTNGRCYADGDANMNNPCEVCSIAKSTSGWSVADGICMIEGSCVANGTVSLDKPCLHCNVDVISTEFVLRAGYCEIEGVCFSEGEKDTTPDTCQSCQPDDSVTAFTPLKHVCTIDGRCYAAGESKPDDPCTSCDPMTNMFSTIKIIALRGGEERTCSLICDHVGFSVGAYIDYVCGNPALYSTVYDIICYVEDIPALAAIGCVSDSITDRMISMCAFTKDADDAVVVAAAGVCGPGPVQ